MYIALADQTAVGHFCCVAKRKSDPKTMMMMMMKIKKNDFVQDDIVRLIFSSCFLEEKDENFSKYRSPIFCVNFSKLKIILQLFLLLKFLIENAKD